MTKIEALAKSCDNVRKHIVKIKSLEEEKRLHLLSYDMDQAEIVIKKQQALSMELENLEKKRISAQNEAGFEGLSGSEILESLDSETRIPLENAFSKLILAADDLQVLNKISLDIAAAELRIIDNITADSAKPVTSGTYGANGKKQTGHYSSYEGKI